MLRFDEFMELALYDPEHGFFASTEAAGQAGGAHGDFITSPEVGPLFGHLVARFIDRCWNAAGQPTEFDVVEWAAGRGALAIAVQAAAPECLQAGALRYHLVELSAPLRARHSEHLPVGEGSAFSSHVDASTLPARIHLTLANELLDNVPFRLFQRRADGWAEVHVGDDATEHLLGAPPEVAAELEAHAGGAEVGARIPLQQRAGEWLRGALEATAGGTVVVVDYARTTAEMAALPQGEWLRTYRGHTRGTSPVESPGSQDITCDVALDQLAVVSVPSRSVSQGDWLVELGIDELVEEGRAIWRASAAAPDVAAMRARSRVNEAEALCDPRGLGGFRVLVWED